MLALIESGDYLPTPGKKWNYLAGTTVGTFAGKTALNVHGNSMVSHAFSPRAKAYIGARVYWDFSFSSNWSRGTFNFLTQPVSSSIIASMDTRVDGALGIRRGSTIIATSAPGVIQPFTWHYIECELLADSAVGTAVIKVDGVEVLNETGLNTGTGPISAISLSPEHSENIVYMRDIYVGTDENTGDGFTTMIGQPVTVNASLANAAGDLTGWTPNVGTNHEAVDESTPDNDTTYVESLAGGDRDAHNFADFALPSDPIAVQVHCVARYESAPLKIATFLRRAATNDDGAAVTPFGSYASQALKIWTQDPIAAGPWTLANLNATQFGLLSVAP